MADEVSGPLDAAWVARKKTSYDELTFAEGALWWIQSDPESGGARRLVRLGDDLEPRPQTPADISVGGWLHAYGGGSYAVGPENLWVVGAEDSKVYRIVPDEVPRAAVPDADDFRYGDLHYSQGVLLAVRGNESGDEIVEVAADGSQVRVLVSSTGFLAAPRLHGDALAYLEWDADRMPWDSSRLHVVRRPGRGTVVAGSENESVVQPLWGPDGALYFLSDRTGWWNLYSWDGTVRSVAPIEADCAPAPWEAGYQSFAFLPDGVIVLTVHDGFQTRLVILGPDGSQAMPEAGLTSIKPYIAAYGGQVAVIGSTPFSAPSLRLLDLAGAAQEITAASAAHNAVVRPMLRGAKLDDRVVRYLFHPPTGGSDDSAAPLIVRAHPGPTDDVPMRLDWTVQYFTSRGFAVAEVAYRGSTGQGRAFRQALHGHWGEYDVADCEAVAEQLLADGVARPGAVFITGASAGGYTALQAACRVGPFTAATATSAIVDPVRWTTTAPRFQRPHARALAGPAGPVHANMIALPVLLIHGTEDGIAPVADAQHLAAGLAARRHDCEAVILAGVGHYLSSSTSLQAALEAELGFYERVMNETA
ncbi:prolyl oligopeptidase family serine peptidase [Streptomyces tateyamensis]|nr:prolyl oligopeptidase family serine peptidase [Streptomyces tateyamensis]